RNGKRTGQFEAELGSNWIGDKNYRGDKATPEGSYKVLRKKAHPETKYYKALLINYPNEDDIRRFEKNKKDGTIGKNASIGNLIEIHGDGGKGIDWTDGCIALTNDDMDDVYAACATGTEIIIVGSLRSFDDITK
ncbi:MAG: L,D-transpeptidase family protein, partial [Cyclobacteriaceae bacterium]|nr:L,D-transpeptidase family protein [Cyclobacteriaceae bacterium]